jgi:hypothetical protein
VSARERAEILRRASERGKDLQRAVGAAFPELLRVSVEIGTASAVAPEDGREVHVYKFGVNLYVSTTDRPDASLSLALSSTDDDVVTAVIEAIARIPSGGR